MLKQHAGCSLGIRDRRILSLLRIILRLNFSRSRKLFHNNAPVTLHCSPATTILNENPEHGAAARTCNDAHIAQNMEPLTSGRGGGVLQNSSDGDDQMVAEIKTPKNPMQNFQAFRISRKG